MLLKLLKSHQVQAIKCEQAWRPNDKKDSCERKVCGWHPVSVEPQVAVMFWDDLCVSNMHFPPKDVVKGIKGPCKNELQTQPWALSHCLSLADAIHPEGSPGSCWGWTPAKNPFWFLDPWNGLAFIRTSVFDLSLKLCVYALSLSCV